MKFKKTKIATFGILTAAILAYLFVEAPNLNPFFAEGAFFWCVVITAYIGIWALFHFGELTIHWTGNTKNQSAFNYVPNKKFPKWTKFVLAAPWVFLVVVMIASSFIFNWKGYRDQIGESEKVEFSSDVQALDVTQIPIVDRELALNLADKKLGERPSLGSQVVKGEPTIQRVDDKLVWVVPLYHSGFFKWITNLSGTPGYVVVSATDMKDVAYVDGYRIKYQPNLYLLDNLKRHIRFSGGYWFTGLTDYSFELDDSGQPFWVVSTYKNTRGFNLPEATGAIIVNATTGAMSKHSLADLPEWVDRVQPENFIINQIDNSGEFVHGWLNFSDKDKFKTSRGSTIVYNNDRCYLFTGLTSVGSDESAIGFMMVDMVTKEPRYYQMNGATEYSAQQSAEGKVQHLGYYASFPIILNVDGQPTYFMTLKDKEKLVKQYAMVSVSNYSSVGTGETVQAAMTDYKRVLKNDNVAGSMDEGGEKQAVNGTISRIASEIVDGETLYKFIVAEKPNTIFTAPASVSDELALTREGDQIKLEYYEIDSPVISAAFFDNSGI